MEARVFTGFLKPGYSIIHLMLRAAARQYGNRVFFLFFFIRRRREESVSQPRILSTQMPHFVFKSSEKNRESMPGVGWGVEGRGITFIKRVNSKRFLFLPSVEQTGSAKLRFLLSFANLRWNDDYAAWCFQAKKQSNHLLPAAEECTTCE